MCHFGVLILRASAPIGSEGPCASDAGCPESTPGRPPAPDRARRADRRGESPDPTGRPRRRPPIRLRPPRPRGEARPQEVPGHRGDRLDEVGRADRRADPSAHQNAPGLGPGEVDRRQGRVEVGGLPGVKVGKRILIETGKIGPDRLLYPNTLVYSIPPGDEPDARF